MQHKGWYFTGFLMALLLLSITACSQQSGADQESKSLLDAGAGQLVAKDFEGAAKTFSKYIDSQSSLALAARKVLAKYQETGNIDKGYDVIKHFESRAKSLPPVDRGEFYRMLGLLAMRNKNTMKEAPALYEKGYQADPSNHGLLNDYAYSLAENERDLDKALELVNKAITLKSNVGPYIDTLGWIYFKQGDYQKALEALKYAAAVTLDNAEIRYHLAEVYVKLNRLDDAKVELDKALALQPDLAEAKELKRKLGLK